MRVKLEEGTENEGGFKPTRIVIESESPVENELFAELMRCKGYATHLRNKVESILDELADPPSPEDF